eukprot:gene189-381_t
MPAKLIPLLKQLSCDIRDIDVGNHVDIITAPVDATCFLRDYVSRNKPVLIQGALQHWTALSTWSPEQLVLQAGHQQVSVDITPNGLGDAVTASEHGDCFCVPHKLQMSFAEFVQLFFAKETAADTTSSHDHHKVVPYLQQQNSNLTEELPVLLPDVDSQLDFAAEAFGSAPEAVNLWIGDERSTTTFHKDHYENLYCVIRGAKVFHLLPPTDVYRMGLQLYPSAQFQEVDGQLKPVLDQASSQVLWCPIHPTDDSAAARAQYPLFFDPDLPKPLK